MTQAAPPHYAYYGGGRRAPAYVSRIVPNNGPKAGGTRIELEGGNLDRVTRVFIGGLEATDFEVLTEHLIRCTTPPSATDLAPVYIFAPNAVLVGQFFYNDAPAFDPLALPWEYAAAAAGPVFQALGLADGAPVNAWPAEIPLGESMANNLTAGTYSAGPPPAVHRGAARGWYRAALPEVLDPPIVWAFCARFDAPGPLEGEEIEYPDGAMGALQQNGNNNLNLTTRTGAVARVTLWNPASGDVFGAVEPECLPGSHLFLIDVRPDRTVTLTIDGVAYDAPNLHAAGFVVGVADITGCGYIAPTAIGDYYFYGLAHELTAQQRADFLQWARDRFDVGRPPLRA